MPNKITLKMDPSERVFLEGIGYKKEQIEAIDSARDPQPIKKDEIKPVVTTSNNIGKENLTIAVPTTENPPIPAPATGPTKEDNKGKETKPNQEKTQAPDYLREIEILDKAEQARKAEIDILEKSTAKDAKEICAYKKKELAEIQQNKSAAIATKQELDALNLVTARYSAETIAELNPLIEKLVNTDFYDKLSDLDSVTRARKLVEEAQRLIGLTEKNDPEPEDTKTDLKRQLNPVKPRANVPQGMENVEEKLYSNNPREERAAITEIVRNTGWGTGGLDAFVDDLRARHNR